MNTQEKTLTPSEQGVLDAVLAVAPAGMREVIAELERKGLKLPKSTIRRSAKRLDELKLMRFYQDPGWVFDRPGAKQGGKKLAAKRSEDDEAQVPPAPAEVVANAPALAPEASTQAEVPARLSEKEAGIDLALAKRGTWSVKPGKALKGVDGEGKPIDPKKWYFSPPGHNGVFSGAYDRRADADKAALELARKLEAERLEGQLAASLEQSANKGKRPVRKVREAAEKKAS